MSYLSRFRHGKSGKVTSTVLTSLGEMGVGYGLGYVQGRWREKAMLMGMPVDLVAGVVGKVAALGMTMTGKGSGWMGSVASTVGTAGLIAYAHTHGVGAGSQKSGVKRILVDSKDVAKVQKILPNATILGALPKAPKGDFLSPEYLAALAK